MKTKIVLDCFGGDYPEKIISGAALTLRRLPEVHLILTGKREKIEEILKREEYDARRLEIIDADEVIANGESPVAALREKGERSSLGAAYRALKADDAAAMISAGSTGAVLCGGIFLLGKCRGVDRPALASLLPADDGGQVCLTDCGANADCHPSQLLNFARYASVYVKAACGIAAPKIGLLSNGSEEGKGNRLTKDAFALLKDSGLNFIGNIEAKEVLSGKADVVVADGFSGNVLLKGVEGTAKSVIGRAARLLKTYLPEASMPAAKKALDELVRSTDFNAQGGALLLGVKKIVVKAHGSACEETVLHTAEQAVRMAEQHFDKLLEEEEERI
ncbi:MAG: phosphate acyltransferase PlsX [Bacillota bacterium]|nr:MAG: phosphate acyltransferase PlsX [Bacillota bacterium]